MWLCNNHTSHLHLKSIPIIFDVGCVARHTLHSASGGQQFSFHVPLCGRATREERPWRRVGIEREDIPVVLVLTTGKRHGCSSVYLQES